MLSDEQWCVFIYLLKPTFFSVSFRSVITVIYVDYPGVCSFEQLKNVVTSLEIDQKMLHRWPEMSRTLRLANYFSTFYKTIEFALLQLSVVITCNHHCATQSTTLLVIAPVIVAFMLIACYHGSNRHYTLICQHCRCIFSPRLLLCDSVKHWHVVKPIKSSMVIHSLVCVHKQNYMTNNWLVYITNTYCNL